MKTVILKLRSMLLPLLCAAVILALTKLIFFIGYVPSASMEPTIPENSWIIGSRIFDKLESGDIVVFMHEGKRLVKRIAAVGGELVLHGGVWQSVPESCFYMLGDNSVVSLDSRTWVEPFIKESAMMAKLIKLLS